MGAAESFEVRVAYALPERQHIVSVRVAAGTTIADAIRQSGILAEHPEIDLAAAKLGVFSRRANAEELVSPNDRIEIYRPLLIDPKAVRRLRAGSRRNERGD